MDQNDQRSDTDEQERRRDLGQQERRGAIRPQTSDEDVPGVRGLASPSGSEKDALEDRELTTWGDEGGAGSYHGAPVVSGAPQRDEGEAPESGLNGA
jgi:hypothetical protein